MTTEDDDQLHIAWEAFCDGLKSADTLLFRDTAPTAAIDRATGYQYLSRYITKALKQKLEFNDPLYPQLWYLQTPTSKSFGDNPDCTYLAATIDGSETYRVVGNRGSAAWVSFAVGLTALNNRDLAVEWDGSFQLMVGPDRHEGNWIETKPGRAQLFIRQYFGDWELETPMTLQVERIGSDGPPPFTTPEQVEDGLRSAVDWLKADAACWAEWIDFYRDRPNTFVQGNPEWAQDGGQESLGRQLHFCHWRLEPDKALIVKLSPPRCAYWNVELDNYWMTSADYRYRLSSLNSKQAVYDRNGSVTIVVSHRDPLVANWLDPAGHTTGLMIQRWVEGESSPTPQAQVVPVGRLDEALGTVERITPNERRQQLWRRKAGVDRRFAF